MTNKGTLNLVVTYNFKNIKLCNLILPALLLVSICIYFIILDEGQTFTEEYVSVQKDVFYYLNGNLAQFPNLEFNLTQLGDALICFSIVAILIIYAPKFWEALLSSALISLLVAAVLKKIFAVPRPATMFNVDTFTIVGKKLTGATSLPSGHSMTIFMMMTLLLFAFMPKKWWKKTIWSFVIISSGFFIALSRVGVGAHYPLDVLIGCTIGYIVAILGILIANKTNWLARLKNKKYYIVLSLIFLGGIFALVTKIMKDNLVIYYLSIIALLVTLYFILHEYLQRKN